VQGAESSRNKQLNSVLSRFPTEFSTAVLKKFSAPVRARTGMGG
jgi:hypothetical protein